MKKNSIILGTALITALATSPVFADKNADDKGKYMEHYQEYHDMNVDMMQMLSETMTILRDINHQPTAEEKTRLSDMIKQLDDSIKQHKEMAERMRKDHHHKMGWDNNDDDNDNDYDRGRRNDMN